MMWVAQLTALTGEDNKVTLVSLSSYFICRIPFLLRLFHDSVNFNLQGHISDATFLQVWQTRARIFLGLNAVVGYDIRNEPLAYGGVLERERDRDRERER